MTRKKKITTEEFVDEKEEHPVLPFANPEPEETQDDKDLAKFALQIGTDGGRVRVYRFDSNGNLVFMGQCMPDVITEEWCQDQYGGGKYQIKLIGADGRYIASRITYIGGPQTKPIPEAPKPENPANLQIDLLRSELAANRDIIMQMIQAMNAQKVNAGGSTFTEIATAMSMLKDVTRPEKPESPLETVKEVMEVLKQGIELGSGGASVKEERPWVSILREIGGVLPALMGQIGRSNNGGQTAAPTEQISPPANVNPLGIDSGLYGRLMRGIVFLKTRCVQGKDVGLWIDMMLDNMDQDEYRGIVGLAMAKNIDEIAALTDREIAQEPYRTWFDNLLTGLKNAVNERMAAERAGGNAADTAANGGAGQ